MDKKVGRRTLLNKDLLKEIYKHRQRYMMVLPCMIFFIVFSYFPMAGIIIAFKDYSFVKGIFGSPWHENYGMRNFIDFFQYYELANMIKYTFLTGFIKVIATFPFPIVFALLLNEIYSTVFKRVVQTVSYLPHFISWAIISVMMFRILAPDDGLLNQVKGVLGLETGTFYLMEEKYFFPIIFISLLWKNIGWSSIIYLAAMSNINPELYESAKIDGAGRLKQIWHITLPGLKPTMGMLFILALPGFMAAGGEQNYLLRTPGNARIADVLDVYVLVQGFGQGRYAYATAIGLISGICGLIMVVAANKLSKKLLETSVW